MFSERLSLRLTAVFFTAATLASAVTGCESEVNPGEPSCEGYENVEPEASSAVTWRFVNATDVPLYLEPATSCTAVEAGFQLFDASGVELRLEGGVCGGSCEVLQEQVQVACPAHCALPPLQMIAPGATFEHVWAGSFWQSRTMPDGCVAQDGGFPQSEPANDPAEPANVECQQLLVAPADAYELRLKVYTVCTRGTDACLCEGTPDASGSCRIADSYAADLAGETLEGKVAFTIPAPGVVELRYEGTFAQGE